MREPDDERETTRESRTEAHDQRQDQTLICSIVDYYTLAGPV